MQYIQAASLQGKPLASMLSSLALLQQAQQQQQVNNALAMLPKRGRGSRGGAVSRSRGGAGNATTAGNLKLKRLDSGEIGPIGRGAGRGRGSRGRRRLDGGTYSNDFLYYMNEGKSAVCLYFALNISSQFSVFEAVSAPYYSSSNYIFFLKNQLFVYKTLGFFFKSK